MRGLRLKNINQILDQSPLNSLKNSIGSSNNGTVWPPTTLLLNFEIKICFRAKFLMITSFKKTKTKTFVNHFKFKHQHNSFKSLTDPKYSNRQTATKDGFLFTKIIKLMKNGHQQPYTQGRIIGRLFSQKRRLAIRIKERFIGKQRVFYRDDKN